MLLLISQLLYKGLYGTFPFSICDFKNLLEDFSFLDYPQGFSLPFFKASAVQH
jgi:hypothetical protein